MKLSINAFAVCVTILALTLTFLISSSVVLGQEGNAGQSSPGYSGAPSAINPDTIDDATVKQTAKAYVKVRQIVQKAQQAISNSSDDAQKQQIAEQAESEKVTAVKAEGVQPQQFNQVMQLARVDKAFQQKFLSYVNEVKNSPS
jgi:hypothetical protein